MLKFVNLAVCVSPKFQVIFFAAFSLVSSQVSLVALQLQLVSTSKLHSKRV